MSEAMPEADLPQRAAQPLVSIIVVNYNGQEHLEACLSALCADGFPFEREIVVVDNASTDGSAALAEAYAARYPFIRVWRSPVNRGYAGGVNLALSSSRSPFVAALNPDMIVSPGWLMILIRFLQLHPEVGAVNPLILLHDSDDRINAAGQDINVTGLGFNRWLGQPRARAGSAPLKVSGLQGGAIVIRRVILDQAGGWDESGFMYHEDVELSWLIQLMGYDLYCLPGAEVRHKYHLTMYPEKFFLLERNRAAMLVSHLEFSSLLMLTPFLLATEGLIWSYCLLRGWAFLKAKAASYGWVARQHKMIAARQRLIRDVRRRTDGQVLRQLRWGYVWDQLLTLGQERGPSRRQPEGGPNCGPAEIGEML
jgi:GT2 family glycosyltransferase